MLNTQTRSLLRTFKLDLNPGRVTQSRHTDMRPAQSIEVQRDVLRILNLGPSYFLLDGRIQLGGCRSRNEERRPEDTGCADHVELLRVGRLRLNGNGGGNSLDPVSHSHLDRVGITQIPVCEL
jgi:hypothetical protein